MGMKVPDLRVIDSFSNGELVTMNRSYGILNRGEVVRIMRKDGSAYQVKRICGKSPKEGFRVKHRWVSPT